MTNPTHDDSLASGQSGTADEAVMVEALRLAESTGRMGNVPVGAIAVHKGRVIARAGNLRETLQDPTAHAEVLAVRAAARALGTWRLEDVTLYVTLEPCAMCAGAILSARVGRLVYGTPEHRTGAVASTCTLLEGQAIAVKSGVCEDASASLLRTFFDGLRARGKDGPLRHGGGRTGAGGLWET